MAEGDHMRDRKLYSINELLQIAEADLDSALNHLYVSGRYHQLKKEYPKLVARIRRAQGIIRSIQLRGFPQRNYSLLRYRIDYVKGEGIELYPRFKDRKRWERERKNQKLDRWLPRPWPVRSRVGGRGDGM